MGEVSHPKHGSLFSWFKLTFLLLVVNLFIYMTEEKNFSLEKEIKELNKILQETMKKNRYFIYSTNPFKFFTYNFIAGIANSLGRTLGTIAFLVLVGFLASRVLSQIDLTKAASSWLQQVVNQTVPQPEPLRQPPELNYED